MSFLTGFKKVLMRFKKTSQVKKSEAIPIQKPPSISGEIIKPKPVTKTTKTLKPIKVHTYNWVLLVVALALTGIALLVFTGQKNKKIVATTTVSQGDGGAEDISAEKTIEIPEEDTKETIAETTPAVIQVSDEFIDAKDQKINKIFEKTIFISCSEGEFKIISIKTENSEIILDTKKCDELASIKAKIDSCAVKLSWTAKKDENINDNLSIEWEDLSSINSKIQTKSIPISFSTIAPPPPILEEIISEIEEKSEPKKEEVKKDDDSFFNFGGIFSSDKEKEKTISKPTIQRSHRKINCRKFASKAYTENGDFLGWIRPTGEVYSPRCSGKIGTRKSNGEVENFENKLIGYDATVYFEKMKLKKKNDTTMEMPKGLVDFESAQKAPPIDWNFVGEDRSTARSSIKLSQPEGEPTAKWGRHQMKDHMGILHSAKMEKVPFTIKSANQISTMPKDEEYVIRRNKPISAVLSYPLQHNSQYNEVLPATAIVERNVYGGSGRTVVIPAGSLLLGHAKGAWPNTYTRFARVALVWDRLVRPDGAEFIFGEKGKPITGDAQGKLGVPGKGSTDYVEQFVKPMMASIVPAAINLISPTAEIYTRKLLTDSDGDLNILETGENKSSEKAKQEMISTWNKIAHKLVDDTLQNTVPPFVVPAGTRLTIYTKKDIMLRFVDDDALFGKGTGYRGLKDDGKDESEAPKELSATDSTLDAVPNVYADIDADVADMAREQTKRDAKAKADAIAFAEANKAQDYSVANNNPLDSFDEAEPVGIFDGLEVFKDTEGYYAYGDDGIDFALTPEEEAKIKFN